jgi:hypothetical protein
MARSRPISAKGTLARARGRPSRAHQSRADGLELGGDGGHALGHDGRVGWCFIWGGATYSPGTTSCSARRPSARSRRGRVSSGSTRSLPAPRGPLPGRSRSGRHMRSIRRFLLSLSLCRLRPPRRAAVTKQYQNPAESPISKHIFPASLDGPLRSHTSSEKKAARCRG